MLEDATTVGRVAWSLTLLIILGKQHRRTSAHPRGVEGRYDAHSHSCDRTCSCCRAGRDGNGYLQQALQYRNCYKNAFAQIEVQIKRRYDLIPKLVETAKGYMRHERETLEAVISARNQAVGGLQKAAQDPGNAEAIRGLADAQRLARDWPTAHPRDSPPSPLSCYFCNGLQNEDARTSRGKWRPQVESHLCGRHNSKEKRRLPGNL